MPPSTPKVSAVTFDLFETGENVDWYVISQISDSGNELRSKVVKALRVTGKTTSANARLYTYGPTLPINVTDLENGTNSITGAVALPDTTQVRRGHRVQVNCPNAALHTIRVAGTYAGDAVKDRLDEMAVEQAIQGCRR